MQIYHVETQDDYDALMVELSYKLKDRLKSSYWKVFKSRTVIFLQDDKITFGSKMDAEQKYPDIPIQNYKAKQKYKAEEYVSRPNKKTLSQAINNVVNSPNHYTQNGRETIENIRDTMSSEGYQGYCVGNVVKYLARYKFKNGLEDVKKARKYIDFLLEELED